MESVRELQTRIESRVLVLKTAIAALDDLKEICEDADLTAGIYEDIDTTKDSLRDIVGGFQASVEALEGL